jgi:hypothetical protein
MSDDVDYWRNVFDGRILRKPGTVCLNIMNFTRHNIAIALVNKILINEELLILLESNTHIGIGNINKKLIYMYKEKHGKYPKLLSEMLDLLLNPGSYFIQMINKLNLQSRLDDILFELDTPDLYLMGYCSRIIFNIYKILKLKYGSKPTEPIKLPWNTYKRVVNHLSMVNSVNISMVYDDAKKLKSYYDMPSNDYTPADVFIGYFTYYECYHENINIFNSSVFENGVCITNLLCVDIEQEKNKVYKEFLEQAKFIDIFRSLHVGDQQDLCEIIVAERIKKS